MVYYYEFCYDMSPYSPLLKETTFDIKSHSVSVFCYFSYFSLFEESKVKPEHTGSASGFISFLGYTPEVFLPLVSIVLIDKNPGIQGFKNFILFLGVLAFVGAFAAAYIRQKTIYEARQKSLLY